MLLCALTVTEIPQMKALVAGVDPSAFVVVSPAQEILGKGFHPAQRRGRSCRSKLIKSGTLITASDAFTADILVEGEVIVQIGSDLNIPDAEVIDARGKLVMPGGVDPHTHFDLPMFGTVSSDDHYTGHKAAAFGGTTTVIDFVSQDAPTLSESVDRWHAKADSKAAVDFSFHCNITMLELRNRKRNPLAARDGHFQHQSLYSL